MAVIQKLRNSGVVVIVIVVALLIFVISDNLNKSSRGGMDERDVAAVVNGEKFRDKDIEPYATEIYKQKVEQDPKFKYDEEARKSILEQAWNNMIREKTYETQVKKSGISISSDDINELMAGEYPVEDLKGVPDFQTDNKFDPKKVEEAFKQAKTNTQLKKWLNTVQEIITKQELEKRYNQYISKAQLKSKVEQDYEYIAANQGATGKLVSLNYNTVPDKDIKITDSDLEKYLKEHKEQYRQSFSSRDVQYVVWEIVPSPEDSAAAKEEAEKLYASWSKEAKPDTSGPDVTGFTLFRDLAEDSAGRAPYLPLFSVPKNTVLPMTEKNGKFTIIQKLDEKKDTADGYVKVAHILIPLSGELPNKTNITDSIQAQILANEILAKVNSGADFGDLAKDYSADPGSANNKGVYDWAKASKYVPEFGKFCLTHSKGQTGIVKTQYGYHVMKMVEDPENMLVKFRKREIEVAPGSKTVKFVDEASRRFRNNVIDGDAKKFEAERDKLGLQPRVKKDLRTDERNIPGIDQSEDVKNILSWLFDSKREVNDISDVFAFSTRHIVVLVTNVRNAGYATVDEVRETIEPLVRNELKAKVISEKFAKHVSAAKTAEDLARAVGGSVVPLESVKMGSNFIPQLFSENKILGACFGVKEKTWSKPVAGNNVVALIWIDSKDKIEIPKTGMESLEDFANNPQFLASRLQEVSRKMAEIQDYRYKFNWD